LGRGGYWLTTRNHYTTTLERLAHKRGVGGRGKIRKKYNHEASMRRVHERRGATGESASLKGTRGREPKVVNYRHIKPTRRNRQSKPRPTQSNTYCSRKRGRENPRRERKRVWLHQLEGDRDTPQERGRDNPEKPLGTIWDKAMGSTKKFSTLFSTEKGIIRSKGKIAKQVADV